ncbi:hypothetical protein EAX61_06285 [Dokdonia sinensis]|uniref:Uncharacterized protein n=1 Tax=Dokdonia sinensis TaxID=2479847 RepID=A0A3M0G7U2_9FLAO|nr:hypothetical protein [Dokdonia sinensis]RMB61081.1 hypothetical protein EAX61_06285 [Dokdonia sinensis]
MSITLASCGASRNIDNSKRDGSSFEKAILVKSISEEYDYVRSNCSGCQLKGQALVFDKKKPYDILTATTPDGKEKQYYFDISKFYGKGF